MNPHAKAHRSRRLGALLAVLGLAVWGRAQETAPDAVIERWDQSWQWQDDGSLVYSELRHVRLNHDRAYGEFADPRITFNQGTDTIEVITARTRRPDGRIVDVPSYSRNEVSPGGPAGWPAFAQLRQLVLTMSAIEPGCLVELEYRITSKPGDRPPAGAEIRLDHRYPITERTVSYRLPGGAAGSHYLRFRTNGHGGDVPNVQPERLPDGGWRWTLRDLKAVPDEPQAPPWQERCWRLTFAAQPLGAWLQERLDLLAQSADEGPLVTRLAREWTRDHSDPADKLAALQEKLAASFNYVDFNPTLWPAQPRRATLVLESNYGLPDESAALLASLARAAGVPCRFGLLVPEHWNDRTPLLENIAAYVLLSGDVHEPTIWHARHGRLSPHGRWAGHALLTLVDGQVRRVALGSATPQGFEVRGKATLQSDGTLTGRLTLRTTGQFVPEQRLTTSDEQRGHANTWLKRVLPDAELTHFAISTYDEQRLDLEIDFKSGVLTKVEDAYRVQLGADGALAEIPLPLTSTRRTQPVRVAAPFEERWELTIAWPEGWAVAALPPSLPAASGAWGEAGQATRAEGNSLVIQRSLRLAHRDLAAAEFLELRGPVQELRAESARTILLRP